MTIEKIKTDFAEIDAKDLVEYASKIARDLAKNVGDNSVGTSQLRKFLDYINRIKTELYQIDDSSLREKMLFLKPKLAYAVSRNYNLKNLYEILVPIIDQVKTRESFKKLARFYESIVAYHKFYTEEANQERQKRRNSNKKFSSKRGS